MNDILLNIAKVLPFSEVNGPGKRTVIWLQGCTLNCDGCFNQEYLPHEAKILVDPIEFASEIVDICKENGC